MSTSDFVSYVFVWHNLSDACEKCKYLGGKEWDNQDLYQNRLWDPIWGDIWDLDSNVSLAHPNCRCQLEIRTIVDWDKWRALTDFEQAIYMSTGYTPADIRQLREDVEALKKQIEDLQPTLEKGPEQLDTWRQLERVALRYLALARRMGLPEETEAAIQLLSRILIIMRMLEISGAMLFSGTPLGLLMGIAGIGMATFTTVDAMTGY